MSEQTRLAMRDALQPVDDPRLVAYEGVRANQVTAGVNGQSVADFEAEMSTNLYRHWNRLSSGSCFPPPTRRIDIPKDDGKTRPSGIPTADRVAQMVVKRFLELPVAPIPQGLLWIPARQVGARCGWRDAPTLRALCLGS